MCLFLCSPFAYKSHHLKYHREAIFFSIYYSGMLIVHVFFFLLTKTRVAVFNTFGVI